MKKDSLKNKKINATNEKKYSSIQYFFWLLSGCEINILKDCPTDYNRQAGIGFTIFMTTVLAFFSGSYAGWYFSENITTAIVFGLLWSALIFSIDRSMVVTLKKDPTKKEQKFWAPLVSRGIMALLIAFIISIPLELLIFQENIELHMPKYKSDQINELKEATERNQDIDSKKENYSRITQLETKVRNEVEKGEPQGDPIYDNLKADYNNKNNEYQSLLLAYNKANAKANIAYNNVPFDFNSKTKDRFSNEWTVYLQKLKIKENAKKKKNSFNIEELKISKDKKAKYQKDWITAKSNEKEKLNQQAAKANEAIIVSGNTIDSTSVNYGGLIKNKKGFVLRFMVLENLASRYKKVRKQITVENSEIKDSPTATVDSSSVVSDTISSSSAHQNLNSKGKSERIEEEEYNPEGETIFFLLWLIRILFFTIEILPTIAKIATPLGAYDFAIYRKEREIEEDLEKRTEDYLIHQKAIRELENIAHQEQVISKNKIENELHAGILKEIASAQNDVAKKQIEDFRKKHSEFYNFHVQKDSLS